MRVICPQYIVISGINNKPHDREGKSIYYTYKIKSCILSLVG